MEIVFHITTYGTQADLYVGGELRNKRVDLRFLAERSRILGI